MQTLLEQPGFSILYDADNCWLFVTWQGPHTGTASREYCEAILKQVHATSSTKILNDSSLDLDGWGDIASWIGEDFFDLLADSGVVAVAWVVPHNLRALMDVNKVLAAIMRPVVGTFSDMEAAYTWLEKSPGSSPQLVNC